MRRIYLQLGIASVLFGMLGQGTILFANEPTPNHSSTQVLSDWPYQSVSAFFGSRGMVVTDAPIANQIGMNILQKGGNAVDAAVATAFALAVVYPAAGNIGGGGFAVVHMNGKSDALDFRETAPQAATRDMFAKPGADSQFSHQAVGVPGSVLGLWELYQKAGSQKLTWMQLLAPSIRLAEEGFVVNEAFVKVIASTKEHLQKNMASAALFLPGGNPPKVGSIWKNQELAKTLRLIAEEGPDGFYQGVVAELMEKDMKAHQGLITKEDLKLYRAKWRKPLEFMYHGYRLVSMPPPSSGGLTLAMMAHMLEPYSFKKLGFQSSAHLHFLFEAMRRAFLARNSYLGDPDFVKNPIEMLLSDKWSKEQRASILPENATPTATLAKQKKSIPDGPHTTHFSVMDEQGNAVGITTTVNFWFGSAITVPGAGFVLNNEMDDFAAKPGEPNGFGLIQGESNAIIPGKRMLSSMAPTLVFDKSGKVKLVLGAAGGPTIITSVFQILSNVIDFGMPLDQAVAAPRFHLQDFPDEVVYEKHGLSEKLRQELLLRGYQLKERERIADAPAQGKISEGFVGVPEPRIDARYQAGW